jgi:hypothetical protein
MSIEPNTPATPRAEVIEMQERAAVCEAVCSGTLGMRGHGKTYLPKWPLEDEKEWQARRDATAFFPAFERAVSTMVGKVLGEPIVRTNIPTDLDACFENIDLAGRDLENWSQDVLFAAIRDSLTFVVVGYPVIPDAGQLSKAQEQARGARPYLIHVSIKNVISWFSHLENGKHVLDEFRYYETTESKNQWAVASTKKIRVLTPGFVQVFAQNTSEEWVAESDPIPVTLKEVPVVCLYAKRTGFFTGVPPLETLAWKNVEHWQSSSDQRNILHIARVPIKFGKMLDLEEDGNGGEKLKISASTILTSGQAEGDLKYVEHSGKAIESGEKDITNIEDQMRRIAGEMLTSESGDETATKTRREGKEGGSRLRSIAKRLEDGLEECLRLMCAWTGKATTGTLAVNMDWDEEQVSDALMATLTTGAQAGVVSQKTYSWNLKEAGRFPEDWSVEDELEEIERENLSRGPEPFGTGNAVRPVNDGGAQ